ncbi:MAG: sugar kinase [Oscillospiraceae bacterium]|nr:sugar kinase [Oscillospiraceae bacterium]MCL2278391.1 sugar kinase [Oscillospiraceae bacterium]
MAKIWTMGELLCEVMRPGLDVPLDKPGEFLGPYPSGAPAIFIDTVAKLGHSAGVIGGVGKDDFGKCLIDRLMRDGVDCTHITQYDDGTTGVAFVTYFGDGSRRFLYHFPDTPATRPKAPDAKLLGDDVCFFHIMGCSLMAKKEFGQEIVKLMHALKDRGAKISFDPNIRPELLKDDFTFRLVQDVMNNCSVFLPGVAELLMISGKDTVEEAIESCFENPTLEVIALKKGSDGCNIYTRDGEISLGVYAVEAKDPTGAGDCFDAAFLCGILEGKNISEAAKIASAAAALNTAAFGPMEGDISKSSVERMIFSPV